MKQLLIMCFLIAANIASAQQVMKIKGFVTDLHDRIPLKQVSIFSSKGDMVKTDARGEFSILSFLGDTLQVRFLGYKDTVHIVQDDQTVFLTLEKQSGHDLLERAVVHVNAAKGHPQGQVASRQMYGYVMDAGLRAQPRVLVAAAPISRNTESYSSFADNSYISPYQQALSTFAADVDGASYSNIKRHLMAGSLPQRDVVRIEEMINYFQYDAPEIHSGKPVGIKTELAASPWHAQHQLMRISLKARDIPKQDLAPANFVFLIDVSGSMGQANKLPLVKSSLKLLVDQLRKQDKVSIVSYAGHAQVRLESVSGDKKMKIKEVIDGLQAGGATAGGDGLTMAYQIAQKELLPEGNNRVIMATDGDFNVGLSSDTDMQELIAKQVKSGVHISVLGFGMGNYKDSKLEILANKGRGNYAYINTISEARKAVIEEFGGTMYTVAKDVKIQVEFNPQLVQYYRLVGYENRLLDEQDFNDDNKLGGDMGVGHMVTAIYDIIPVGVNSDAVASVDPLKYQKNKQVSLSGDSKELATVKFRYKDVKSEKSQVQAHIVYSGDLNAMSSDFNFASAVAELGMLLRNSEFKGTSNYASLISRAQKNKGEDLEGYRAEFIRMAKNAEALSQSQN